MSRVKTDLLASVALGNNIDITAFQETYINVEIVFSWSVSGPQAVRKINRKLLYDLLHSLKNS